MRWCLMSPPTMFMTLDDLHLIAIRCLARIFPHQCRASAEIRVGTIPGNDGPAAHARLKKMRNFSVAPENTIRRALEDCRHQRALQYRGIGINCDQSGIIPLASSTVPSRINARVIVAARLSYRSLAVCWS